MKKILLLVGILAIVTPAFAGVTTKDSTSTQYLRNYGYSESANRYIQTQKAMSNGDVYYNSPEFNECSKFYGKNKFRNFVVGRTRAFFTYLDPSEDACRFMDHDIRYNVDPRDY